MNQIIIICHKNIKIFVFIPKKGNARIYFCAGSSGFAFTPSVPNAMKYLRHDSAF